MKSANATVWLLVRHAESTANAGQFFGSQSDAPLTARGREQVVLLTESLASMTVHHVYSSDLSRARDTVAEIASTRGLQVQTTELLRERNMGLLTGMSFERVQKEHPDLWSRWNARDFHTRPPEGESYADVTTRVAPWFDALRARHEGETVVIGSHGGTLNAVLRYVLGLADSHVWFGFGNASVTKIEWTRLQDGTVSPRLVYLNRHVAEENRATFG